MNPHGAEPRLGLVLTAGNSSGVLSIAWGVLSLCGEATARHCHIPKPSRDFVGLEALGCLIQELGFEGQSAEPDVRAGRTGAKRFLYAQTHSPKARSDISTLTGPRAVVICTFCISTANPFLN